MLQLDQVKQSGYAFLSEYQPHKSSEVALGQFGPLLKLVHRSGRPPPQADAH